MVQIEDSILELASKFVDNFKNNRGLGKSASDKTTLQNQKTIFLIGAGASHAVANLPLGKELADMLVKNLGCNTGSQKTKFEDLLFMMEKNYGFDKDDFKTILFSLNHINSETLVDQVENSLLNNCTQSYSYGFIASLLSERYIDAIINFNFDEILDIHLTNKINQRHFLNIHSDENCPSELSFLIKSDGHLVSPVYIKPHGTISNRKSLRFVRKDFYQIEPLQKQLIKLLFSAIPVNLILVGFRLKFFEFSKIIEEAMLPGWKKRTY